MPESALPDPIRAALNGSTFGQRREDIFRRLQQTAQQTSQNYSGKRELATERDDVVQELCEALEETFAYGLRQSLNVSLSAVTLFQNMHEIVLGSNGNGGGGAGGSGGENTFWDFCQSHLTPHERQRYEGLKQIWTKHGRGRAFIRATLNEKRLHSHLLTWLSDESQIQRYYTPWSLLLNEEAAKQLPDIIGSLQDVLFALNVENPELNAAKRQSSQAVNVVKEEPIIYSSPPVPVSLRKTGRTASAVERPIVCATSTEDLLGALSPREMLEVQQIISKDAVEHELQLEHSTQMERVTIPCDPIEPELEFLKTPLPDVYPTSSDTTTTVTDQELFEDRSDTSSQWSKSSSSANGASNSQHTAVLEDQVMRLNEKCALLETRVAELTRQNRQLVRRLTKQFNETGIDPASSFCSNFLITIPQVKLVKTQRSGSHYVYEIHITMRQQLEHWTLFRRYNEFNKLHKSLLRTHPNISSIEFPPKKHFGNMNLVFVEERRQQLQIYLLNIVETLPQVEGCKTKGELQKAFPFFRER
ncbi:sorting nexin-29 [Drosophila nasuta]|uniref:Sorting nexin-29 n=1 Tax=Drosophila albomicans TaxID=7291 RepID=A0A6P8W1H8_DROAB|nr:sorting nexin-29 [Drosophila albomicans]XP_060651906.1 sorting nexin-29 [Drosophila nasuta]